MRRASTACDCADLTLRTSGIPRRHRREGRRRRMWLEEGETREDMEGKECKYD